MFRSILLAPFFLGASIASVAPASAQDLVVSLYQFDPFLDAGPMSFAGLDGFKGQVGVQVAVEAIHDSNLFLTSIGRESDTYLEVTPTVFYDSDPEGGAQYRIFGGYSPTIKRYWNNSNLNTIDHAANVNFEYESARAEILAYLVANQFSGADRFNNGFVEGRLIKGAARMSYQLAPRTSLRGELTARLLDYDSGPNQGFDRYSAEFGVDWDATYRLQLGPAIRFGYTDSKTTGSLQSVAVLGRASFFEEDALNWFASAGFEFTDASRGGGNDLRFTGKLRLHYPINDRWDLYARLGYARLPSSTSVNYLVDDWSLATYVVRTLNRGQIEAGIDFGYSDYELIGISPVLLDNETYFGAYLKYKRKFYNERMAFESMVRYSTADRNGGWTQWLLSAGVTIDL